MALVMDQVPLDVSFQGVSIGDKLATWHNLAVNIASFWLSDGRDSFTWDLNKNGIFSLRSMYMYLINQVHPLQINLFGR